MDVELVNALNDATTRSKLGRAKKRVFGVWDQPGLEITGWKFNEWDYSNAAADLPTLARGLFTLGNRIVVRGYDKFFNVGEVPSSKWESITSNTHGPYYATVKENGCLVLITGIDGRLVVTSKHSSGPRDNEDGHNHSRVAKDWVRRHLARAERTETDLATELESRGITAVGELCDDKFEEHVLPYEDEESGIYLTGLNANKRKFVSLGPSEVAQLAHSYGFHVTRFLSFDNLDDLKQFLDDCAETGSWSGRDIEGFVIRTKLADGSDFFFKYKFEEPYFMYRQWREVTRAFLTWSSDPLKKEPPKIRGKHAESSLRYLEFIRGYLPQHPELVSDIMKNGQGFIALRKQFLAVSGVDETELVNLSLLTPATPKWIIVPVATIGCGKTTVSVALSLLFGWGHLQNDDITNKRGKPAELIRRASDLLETHDVVILDRNNTQRRERAQIFDDMPQQTVYRGFDIRYVCLNFLPTGPTEKSRQLSRKRVLARGDNHQTIRNMPEAKVLGIMGNFEGMFQPVNPIGAPDDHFDTVIDLKVNRDSTRENIECIISTLRERYPDLNLRVPTSPEIDQAVVEALAYKPKISGPAKTSARNSDVKSYFGLEILPEGVSTLLKLVPSEAIENKRIQKELHVTLAHGKRHKSLFEKLKNMYSSQLDSASAAPHGTVSLDGTRSTLKVTGIYWNSRVTAFKVKLPDSYESGNDHPHITVATAREVAPVESNEMLIQPEAGVELDPAVDVETTCFLHRK